MTDDRQKSILLVEDEAVIALNQKRQLIDEGYYVVHVFNGASALETLKNNNGKIDLILMDIDLGKGMNGPEIACEICKFSDIPIIFLSSHTDKESVELTEKSASYGYVLKQAGQAVLFASIKLAFKLWDANQKIKLRDKELEDTNRKLNIINETLENTNLKLKESEAQIRFITNNLPSSLLYQMDVGEDGSQRKFLHISDKVEVLHGVKAKDALKDSSIIYKQIVEEDIGALLEGEIEAIKKMKPFAKEVRIKLPSGEINWRQFISEPVKLPEGGYIWNGIETDVTERKSTETVIKNTEKKFKSIVENSFEAVTLIDERGKIIYDTSSNYIRKNSGAVSLIGKSIFDAVYKEDASHIKKIHQRLLEKPGTKINGIQYRILRPDGRVGWIEGNAVNLTHDPSVRAIVLNSRDVTERKTIESELRDSEEKFSKFFQYSPIIFTISSIDTERFIEVNNKFIEVTGYNYDELIGKTTRELNLFPDKKDKIAVFNEIKENGEARNIEVRLKTKNGDTIVGLFSAVKAELGGKKRWFTMMEDITKRKSAETSLAQTNELLSLFIKNSPIHAFIKEVSPDISRTLYASENYLDMIGIPGSKMIGKTMYELFPKEHAEKFTKDDWDVVSSGRTLKLDEDLNNRAYYTIKFPIIQNDKKLLAGYTIEITDRKEKEEKIKKLLNENEEILREVHHRIKNNMSTILSLFRIQSDKQENAVIKSVFLDASNRLKSMMVLYDKLYRSTNKNELRLKEYLTSLAEEIINIFPNRHKIESVIGVGNLMCKPEILSPLGIIVNEMINNSMKYAFNDKDKGKIKIFVKKRNDYAVFSYEDNGPGIPESVSLENTPGYGLRMIKSLVDQIDGSITLERNRGAKYVIKFII